ncbi:hypothetical protein VTI28DRAFT_2012 [Corynascus sepedonium]
MSRNVPPQPTIASTCDCDTLDVPFPQDVKVSLFFRFTFFWGGNALTCQTRSAGLNSASNSHIGGVINESCRDDPSGYPTVTGCGFDVQARGLVINTLSPLPPVHPSSTSPSHLDAAGDAWRQDKPRLQPLVFLVLFYWQRRFKRPPMSEMTVECSPSAFDFRRRRKWSAACAGSVIGPCISIDGWRFEAIGPILHDCLRTAIPDPHSELPIDLSLSDWKANQTSKPYGGKPIRYYPTMMAWNDF